MFCAVLCGPVRSLSVLYAADLTTLIRGPKLLGLQPPAEMIYPCPLLPTSLSVIHCLFVLPIHLGQHRGRRDTRRHVAVWGGGGEGGLN